MEAFITEYETLCRKHGLYLDCCGCCDSPWIVKTGDPDAFYNLEEHIAHLRKEAEKHRDHR